MPPGTQESFAEKLGADRSTVGRWERGVQTPQPWQRPDIAAALDISLDHLDDLLRRTKHRNVTVVDPIPAEPSPSQRPFQGSVTAWTSSPTPTDDGMTDMELARRVAASDVGDETLLRLELAFDELAMAYPVTPPGQLLIGLRHHLRYVADLMDARMTLRQRKRLIVVGG